MISHSTDTQEVLDVFPNQDVNITEKRKLWGMFLLSNKNKFDCSQIKDC